MVAAGLVLLLGSLIWIASGNLASQGIATGYGFLERQARFEISESLIPYSAADTYGRALLVGFLNTLKVALTAIVLATIIGTVVGICRLSPNLLLAGAAGTFVEAIRNVPLLLQLSFWYGLVTISMPPPRSAINVLDGIYLSNRGIIFPALQPHPAFALALLALGVGAVAIVGLTWWARRRQNDTGTRPVLWPVLIVILVVAPTMTWALAGAPTALDVPVFRGFNFVGGFRLSPEFCALLLGLTVYCSAFIAETVRGGILAVGKGQSEAGRSLGLRPGQVMRLVILPQALRIIIPPITSQYLNLIKSSSLGVAIAYPDIVSIGNITMNQTGQAIEVVSIFMIVYLTISLCVSGFMNWYNKRVALVSR